MVHTDNVISSTQYSFYSMAIRYLLNVFSNIYDYYKISTDYGG